ncbi:thiol:disulfide interchange protein DsbC [Natronospira proteinivora]|uniref:Thiol:disulfide interchange protein n=1 Tax=Natronospira proteinivora TaxID=1807133 RepID=A0ABT1G4Y2_9GAMM|nr:DsbC family protein [Natronospira proteinivora]MCP1726147.1 thiol:disulfide interchange protein DsbC [Natronospira proteinivora]
MRFKTLVYYLMLAVGIMGSAPLAAEQDHKDIILKNLEQHLPNLSISREQLRPSPIDGLWILTIGPEVVYVDEEGEHLFQGDMIHLPSRENLSEADRAEARRETLSGVDPETRLSYIAEEEAFNITVFTDIDCGYCRQLHRDMDELNKAGISVHYLFYPRGGEGTAAWEKSDQVWCADDKHEAMDEAKSGANLQGDTCEETPTEAHFQLGRQMQVSGTPTIITESGHIIRGYVPADNLISRIRDLENGD